jgi:hypothetical protein
MEIDDARPWRKKLEQSVRVSYARAPFFDEAFPLFQRLLHHETKLVAAFNLETIRVLTELLGIATSKLVLGSQLAASGAANELLISMVQAVGGTAYLSGGGSAGYLDERAFAAAGLGLVLQSYAHPVYPQKNVEAFVPGLSILDALMSCGVEGTRRLLQAVPR